VKRVESLQFLQPKHLDIDLESLHIKTDAVCAVARDELYLMNSHQAPLDKLVCILRCCKHIFNELELANKGKCVGADDFIPLLIYVVLKSKHPTLASNIQYICNFHHPSTMTSEAGYYFIALVGAVNFIETLDASVLSIDPMEFHELLHRSSQQSQPITGENESREDISPPEKVGFENNATVKNQDRNQNDEEGWAWIKPNGGWIPMSDSHLLSGSTLVPVQLSEGGTTNK